VRRSPDSFRGAAGLALAALLVAGCATTTPIAEVRSCVAATFVAAPVVRPVCSREICHGGKVELAADLSGVAPVDDWAEERFCATRPFTCVQAYRMKEESDVLLKSLIGKRWTKEEVRYGLGDAVRHAFVMCRIAERFGADFARGLGVAHEDDSGYLMLFRMGEPSNRCCERDMDLYNNEVGISLSGKPGSCEEKVLASTHLLRHSVCKRGPDIILEE